ncbi:MAG: hypothetical protein JWQ11_1193 [Rhizobacter sp.]|nr:hypothetical protein [Rhizobacter sp.]
MIPRIDISRSDIELSEDAEFEYRVTYEAEGLFDDAGFTSVMHALVAAIEGLSPEVAAVEVSFEGIVSGTYPLQVLAMNPQQIAEHAVNTTSAVQETLHQ